MTERLATDTSSGKGVRLFYAVGDFFPPWRLDVDELFSRQLPAKGLELTWAARRKTAGPCRTEDYNGRPVWLPWRVAVGGNVGKALNKLLQYGCELVFFFRLLFGPGFDIVQARDRRYFFAFLLVLAAKLRGWCFVYWLSYPFPESTREAALSRGGISRWLLLLAHWFEWHYVYRFLIRVADHTFVQSEQMMRDISAYGVPVDRMTPVPMGVPPALLDWQANNPTGIVPGRVVYVGTMVRVRKLEVLVEAFAQVATQRPDASLIMVGDGVIPSERAFLEQEVMRLGISDQVRFTGFVPMEEAWRYAASAQVCVSPIYPIFILRAGSPTKLNEYFALGRPVVANDHPEQSTAINDSGAGLCVSWGADDFAGAILRLLNNSEMAEAMAAKGPAWVKANRTYDRIANQVLARYQSLIGR